MKKLLFTILAVSTTFSGFCQTSQNDQTKDPEAYRVKKNEISVGLFNAFNLNSNPTPALSYKRYTQGGAYRLTLGGNYFMNNDSRITTQGQNILQDKESSLSANVGLGYEWHIPMHRWMLYYGGEAKFYYSNQQSIFETESNPFQDPDFTLTTLVTDDETSLGYGLESFLGMKFWINQRISLNTEFSATFRYTMNSVLYEQNGTSTDPNYTVNQIEMKDESAAINAFLSPLGRISFNYHF